MNEVAIVGVGHSKFGELEGQQITDFGSRAVRDALLESNVEKSDIEEAYIGNVVSAAQEQRGSVGQAILREVGMGFIPVTRVENACASSTCGLREAYRSIKAGQTDVALVMGAEKMTGVPTEVAMSNMAGVSYAEVEGAMGITFMGVYGLFANAYADKFGVDVLEPISDIAVKNHRNASKNPYAHFDKEITRQDAIQSPVIAEPIRLLHSSPLSDGGVAAVVARADIAEDLVDDPVYIDTIEMGTWYPRGAFWEDGLGRKIATQAYEQAGIGPDDVDVVELHDASTMGELMRVEALGLAERGEAPTHIANGEFELDGRVPVNPSGGLKARGHPIGATGLAQIIELTWQLRGEAGARQVDDPEVALAQNSGGSIFGKTATCTTSILRR
jgi:acetyl-CoA C-acetyltransferase